MIDLNYNLDFSDDGGIKVYDDVDMININNIKLYCSLVKGSVVFFDFGINFYNVLFRSVNYDIVSSVVDDLRYDLSNKFGVDIENFYYELLGNVLNIYIVLKGNKFKFSAIYIGG